jgi:Cu(I)/Ag(I) efflux system membrane protein CusA/SilA
MVVYLEEALHRKADPGPMTRERIREAAMEGAVLRLRPKLMTVSTVVFGLLPVLGGMVSSLFHVLIVTPVIWTMLKKRELARGKLEVGKVSDLRKA